jgi:hypothetical protein
MQLKFVFMACENVVDCEFHNKTHGFYKILKMNKMTNIELQFASKKIN